MYSFFPLYTKDHHSSRETGVFTMIWFLVNVCPQSDLDQGRVGWQLWAGVPEATRGEAFGEADHPRAWSVLWFFLSTCSDFIFSPRHFVGRLSIIFPDQPGNLALSLVSAARVSSGPPGCFVGFAQEGMATSVFVCWKRLLKNDFV